MENKTLNTSQKNRSPWSWIPTLYFAQGLPYVAVMTISVILYKRLGISNTDIALYTSWLYLPWVIKPFWSPFVDLIKTKRWWIVSMQLIVGIGFACIAFTLPTTLFFQMSLAVFWLMGFSSATHDIAADGFYMLALDSHSQSMFVGIRSTFYRFATIFGQGILVIIAGLLEIGTGKEPVNIIVDASPVYTNELIIPQTSDLGFSLNSNEAVFIIQPDTLKVSTSKISKEKAQELKDYVVEYNIENGFTKAFGVEETKDKNTSWWTSSVSQPLGNWIQKNFGKKESLIPPMDEVGAVAIAAVQLSKAPESGNPVVLNSSYKDGDKSIFLIAGERLEFTSDNWDKPALIAIQLDSKLDTVSTASFRGLSGNIPLAWSITFGILAVFFLGLCVYHYFILPKPSIDKPAVDVTAKSIFKEFIGTFISFFKKKQVGVAILFMLLYRLPEAQIVKLVNPFLLDPKELGGLGLTTGQVGMVYGTVGILGLTIGGIVGGIVAAKGGLKKWLWPMACSLSLTCIVYVYLAYFQDSSLLTINICIFFEQFGYGFGFTAYMLYMIYFSEGEYKTAHYAICTAFMALGMMLPGMFAGWLQEQLGYINFFWWVMICCAATLIVTAFIKVDPNFGKKDTEIKEA